MFRCRCTSTSVELLVLLLVVVCMALLLIPLPLSLPPCHGMTHQAVKKNSRVLVMCAVGGTLDTNVSYRRDKKLFAGLCATFLQANGPA
jgi:hypothetical protein